MLRFETSTQAIGKLSSFAEYLSRKRDDQQVIYYVVGEKRDQMLANPLMEYYHSRQIEVLLLSDPVDSFTVAYLNDIGGVSLESIEKTPTHNDTENTTLLTPNVVKRLKEIIGDEVEDVEETDKMVSSPSAFFSGKQGLDSHTERMMKVMDKNFKGSKKIFGVNPNHELIRKINERIESDANDELSNLLLRQLYDLSKITEGELENPSEFHSRMTEIMMKTLQN